MRLDLLFGGKQGKGVDKVASVAAEMFSSNGQFVFKYRDYGSLIKGGRSFDVLSVSDKPIASHRKELDGVLALDEKVVEEHEDRLAENGIKVNAKDIGDESELGITFNMILLGAAAKIAGLKFQKVEKALKKGFEGKKEEIINANIGTAEKGYEDAETKYDTEERDREIKVMDGSVGIVEGAIESGIDAYFGYPMTPMTPVLHKLAGKQKDENIVVFQPENELSVVNAGLGSSHTGAKTMVGSSGGGYDLMQEAMSMQGISEIPLVVYLSQRAGAGSGIPTYQAQGDLDIATKGGHGEFPRVTIAPGDAKEAIEATNQAFYFTENFRVLSVLLGDKHLAESDFSFEGEPRIKEVGRNIDKSDKGGEFDNYKITKDGNSPRSVPGLNVVNSTSYEHDEYGITIEDEETINGMTEKRNRKGDLVAEKAKQFNTYKVHGKEDSNTVVVGWGSTKGAIKDAVEKMDVKFLQILYLRPFPDEVKDMLEGAEKVILVENNSTGLLGKLIMENISFEIDERDKILKYDGRPFRSDELKGKIKERI